MPREAHPAKPQDGVRPSSVALIVDDNQGDRITAKRLLTHNPHVRESLTILEATSVPEALRAMADHPVEIALLDMHLGADPNQLAQNGVENIPEMLKRRPFAQILVLSGSEKAKDAARAMKLGAYDFVTKGTPKDEKQRKVADAIAASHARFKDALHGRIHPPLGPSRLGGKSPQWRKSISDAIIFAGSEFPVLITGETGTGKTELARMIHEERAKIGLSREFIPLNIAALTPELAERELFGNEPEAFTGATKLKHGFCELADKGTLFLDEIGDASPDLQTKLLKVIEEGTFFRLGGDTEIRVRFKLVCATHKDLKKMVKEGTFREDLYMRISTLPIHIRPLSERKQDTPEITAAILPRVCDKANLKVPVHFEDLPGDFIEYIVNTHFPGNARGIYQQLARLIVRAPNDKAGKKILSHWREYLEVSEEPSSLSLQDTLLAGTQKPWSEPIDFDEPNFPGINELTSRFQDHVYREARRKCRSINHVARVLKVSPSTAYANLKRMGEITRRRKHTPPTSK